MQSHEAKWLISRFDIQPIGSSCFVICIFPQAAARTTQQKVVFHSVMTPTKKYFIQRRIKNRHARSASAALLMLLCHLSSMVFEVVFHIMDARRVQKTAPLSEFPSLTQSKCWQNHFCCRLKTTHLYSIYFVVQRLKRKWLVVAKACNNAFSTNRVERTAADVTSQMCLDHKCDRFLRADQCIYMCAASNGILLTWSPYADK